MAKEIRFHFDPKRGCPTCGNPRESVECEHGVATDAWRLATSMFNQEQAVEAHEHANAALYGCFIADIVRQNLAGFGDGTLLVVDVHE